MSTTPTPWIRIKSKKHAGAIFFKEKGANDNFVCKFYAGHEEDARFMEKAIAFYQESLQETEDTYTKPVHVLHEDGTVDCSLRPETPTKLIHGISNDQYLCPVCGADLTDVQEEMKRVTLLPYPGEE